MHLTYIDEVKFAPPSQNYHWLCALAFPEASIQAVDERLAALATEFFGNAILSTGNEFHACDIVQGKGPYKGRKLDERVTLFKHLLDVIDTTDDLGRIAVRIEPSRMIAADHESKAFMFLVEKVDDYMRQRKSLALLIADEDQELLGSNVTSLSSYKLTGTKYQFGKPIERVIDTIHHTRSHHSRLLQLADVYVYCLAMVEAGSEKYPRSELIKHSRSKSNLLHPSKFKYWPTEDSWLKPT